MVGISVFLSHKFINAKYCISFVYCILCIFWGHMHFFCCVNFVDMLSDMQGLWKDGFGWEKSVLIYVNLEKHCISPFSPEVVHADAFRDGPGKNEYIKHCDPEPWGCCVGE